MGTRTYVQAGAGGKPEVVAALVRELRYRRRGGFGMVGGIGHFTSLIGFGDHVLSLAMDCTGSKLLVAQGMGKWDTVGIDCVAMNVNDMACANVEPVAFTDYLAMERPSERVAGEIARGLDEGARRANVTIVGGEVSILPDQVRGVDLAGTCLGVARRRDVVTGKAIRRGDAIVGVASAGIHANGLTLARRVLAEAGLTYADPFPGGHRPAGLDLLEPTAIYVRQALRACRSAEVHGMGHITGGGLRNLLRLKPRVGFAITDPLPPQGVFASLQELADIADEEMYQTFNMGMGFAVIAPEDEAREIARAFRPHRARVVGQVVRGSGVIVPSLALRYTTY